LKFLSSGLLLELLLIVTENALFAGLKKLPQQERVRYANFKTAKSVKSYD